MEGVWTSNEGVLPKDEIKNLLISFNRVMDFNALTLELRVIKLKQHVSWIFNSAVTGAACGKLLDILEATYSYPELLKCCQQGMSLATFSYLPSVSEPDPDEYRLLAGEEIQQAAELAKALDVDLALISEVTTKQM